LLNIVENSFLPIPKWCGKFGGELRHTYFFCC